jgi:hypothetical protein
VLRRLKEKLPDYTTLTPVQLQGYLPEVTYGAMPLNQCTVTVAVAIGILSFILAASQPAIAHTYTVLHNFSNGADGRNPHGAATFDTQGNIYGTTTACGSYPSPYGVVWEITP